MSNQIDTRLDTGSLTVELFVCASMYGTYEKQNDIIHRIDRLADRGVVDEFDRYTWARELSPAAEDTWCEFAREKYEEFTRWAELSNRTLEPAFTRRSVSNDFVGEHYEVIQFPILSIAVYAGDRLVRLSPSVDADGVAYTVGDCLSELEQLAEQQVRQPQHVPGP
ncbi:HTH domain-containing protein [Haloarchaeobius litoreus]|uniref:HTH domain-containing protein n=1 Tax=Haloarchaeobius litoreus TaxID=755306 RepID=A0ABD6DNF4_9EURY|nr:HTH domain-containing protein [Haloarchaeobius litoreus]